MAFFIVERETADDGLRLPVSGSFATREEALAALSAAVASGDAMITGGQVYVVDLEAAVPVLVIPAPAVVAPVSESENAETAMAEAVSPAVVEGPESEMPLPGESGATEDGASLADALRRATSSLEESGIRAPESVGAHEDDGQGTQDLPEREDLAAKTNEDVDEQHESEIAAQAYIAPELRDLPVATAVAEPMGSAAEADEAPFAVAPVDGSEGAGEPGPAETPVRWPWANVEAYEPEEEESARDFEAVSASEESDTLIASAPPVGEDAYLPKPVILGDYGDAADDGVSAAFEEQAAAGGGASEAPASAPGQGYEVSGSLDMSAYTCSDCIYSNTCPKVGEVAPAECGTFQWMSS